MKRYITIILIGLVSVQCADVIDTPPQGSLAEGLNSEQISNGLVAAAYQGLSANLTDVRAAFIGPSSNWVMDVRSDDAYTGGENAAALGYGGIPQIERGVIFPSDAEGDGLNVPLNKWRNNYVSIARVNDAIRSITDLESTSYPKVTRLAEMFLLRAHFHFDLMRTFGKIAYITAGDDPLTSSNTEYSEEELWGKIETDLILAYDALPIIQDGELGRVNKYTAAAYLTKLYVETQDWAKAIQYADEVLGGPYSLMTEFENLATIQAENGSESIFAFQYSRGNSLLGGQEFPNHSWSNLLNTPSGGGYSGDGFYLASQDLANVYRTSSNGLPLFNNFNNENVTDASYVGNLDPRIDFTFGRLGIPWKQTGNYTTAWIRSAADYPHGRSGKKHVLDTNDPNINASGVGPHGASGLNYQYIRLAEVYLWKAEALIESNGDLDQARQLINDVRRRAMNSTYVQRLDGSGNAANYVINEYPNEANWTQDYARQALRFERRLELAMEGHRMYDLMRWGTANEVMDAYFSREANRAVHLAGEAFDFDGSKIYLPIPQEEIDLAPKLYEQRDEY